MSERIDEIATNSKKKNIREVYKGINEFKRGYQPRSNLVKDENGDLLADSHNISNFETVSRLFRKCGNLDLSQSYGTLWIVTGITLSFFLLHSRASDAEDLKLSVNIWRYSDDAIE
jgi:hypothetical protein